MAEIKFYQDAAKTHQVYPEINPDGNYPGVTVGLADNLTFDEGIEDTDTWQFRTSGGEEDITDGYATLKKLIGTTTSSTIEESLTYNLSTTGVQEVNISTSTFKTQISNSGTYNFTYVPDISYNSQLINTLNKITFAGAVEQTPGTYVFTYAADIDVDDSQSLIGTFSESAFISKVGKNPRQYVFTYNSSKWYLDGNEVTLSQYGITISGTPSNDDSFTIDYISNDWYLSSVLVNMSGYGITTTDTENVGDTITITYTKNEWDLSTDSSTIENITLSTYGITITNGTPNVNDLIQIIYVAEEIGAIVTSYPSYMHTIGLNQFNKEGTQILTGYTIGSDGAISASSGSYVIYFKATPETYTIEDSIENSIVRVGYITTIPTTSSTVTVLDLVTESEWMPSGMVNNTTRSHYLIENEGYLCVATTDIENLCCHLTWEGVNEGVYESYNAYDMVIPYTDDNGTLIREYGLVNLDNTTEYYDEIDFVANKWYERTTRIAYSAANLATVQALEVPYMYDSNYIYYGTDTVVHNLSDTSSEYRVADYGTEELIGTNTMPCVVSVLYQQNLKNKLAFSAEVIDNKVDTLSDSNTDMQYPSALCVQKYLNGTNGMGNIVVDSINTKNLLNSDSPSNLVSGGTWAGTGKTHYYSSTTVFNGGVNWFIPVKAGESYTFSYKQRNSQNIYLYIQERSSKEYVSGNILKQIVNDGTQTSYSFTIENDSYLCIAFQNNQTVSNVLIEEIQLERGLTKTNYVSYQGLLDEKNIGNKNLTVGTLESKNILCLYEDSYKRTNNGINVQIDSTTHKIHVWGTSTGTAAIDIPLQQRIYQADGPYYKTITDISGTYTGIETSLRGYYPATSVGLWSNSLANVSPGDLSADARYLRITVQSGITVDAYFKIMVSKTIETYQPFIPTQTLNGVTCQYGSWTPTLENCTYSAESLWGFWMRIGNLVYLYWYFRGKILTVVGTGHAAMKNLPFYIDSSTNGCLGYCYNVTSSNDTADGILAGAGTKDSNGFVTSNGYIGLQNGSVGRTAIKKWAVSPSTGYYSGFAIYYTNI